LPIAARTYARFAFPTALPPALVNAASAASVLPEAASVSPRFVRMRVLLGSSESAVFSARSASAQRLCR
jgi:hypothetical protein